MSIRTPQAGVPWEDPASLRHYGRLKPGPSQPRPDVIASQRARLQRAIVELAARDGLDAVTVRRLTKLAGVSTATFYSRFSGTDDCLLTTYEEIMASAARSIVDARSPDLGPAEQLDRALRVLLARLLADRDVARFVLIEIYGGGPAAISAIGDKEGELAAALRGCVDRRGRRIPKVAVAAIIAAVLHCARAELIDAAPEEASTLIDALVEWATDVVEGRDEVGIPTAAARRASPLDPSWAPGGSASAGRDERGLIEAAILQLALPDGFRALDPGKVSSASGLPAACFRRHFGTLADGYLAAIRRTSGSFFAELTAQTDPAASARTSIRAALHKASRRAASDPAAAHLTFRQVIEPGVAGLTCRETLISELALACTDGPGAAPSMRVRAEARVAALWEALAQGAQATAGRRPRAATAD
ncbi:MAG TPA: TetR/AcrR family transcriptional regulator [Solirubrobacterales bacterium]|nr:TetR/AcrR family transcriptional regulator [Solirubrobacterales bacterium]